MGTINQPTPSNPKSPQPATEPLQPGAVKISHTNTVNPQRVNPQTPDTQHEKLNDDPKKR